MHYYWSRRAEGNLVCVANIGNFIMICKKKYCYKIQRIILRTRYKTCFEQVSMNDDSFTEVIIKIWKFKIKYFTVCVEGPSWPWSYGSWIYNYLCNQCLSPLVLWVQIWIRARCTTLCDKVCQWLATGRWFSSPNKTDRHNITEILLKMALNTIKQHNSLCCQFWDHHGDMDCR
jgi:hypothetical protein